MSKPMFFFLRNSSPLFSITRSSSFSVIQVSVNTRNNAEKDTTLLLSGRHCDFFPNNTLSCIWVAMPVDWVILHWYACGAYGRSLARCTVKWLPNFLGWVDYHISLAMGLRPRAVRTWSSATNRAKCWRRSLKIVESQNGILLSGVKSQFHPGRPRRRDFPSPSISAPGSPRMGQI